MRPAPRIFTRAPLGRGTFGLDQAQARYLGSVLRLKEGDEVRLFNGQDGEWVYRLGRIARRDGTAEPVRQRRPQAETAGPVLLFAPLKRGPTEFLVQKATELGAAVLRPVITRRTNRDQLRTDRLETIAVEAAEQCERLSIPRVEEPRPLSEALAEESAFVFCDEAGEEADEPWGGEAGRAGLADHVFGQTGLHPGAVLIGPEGGFTPEEREEIRSHRGAVPISLGPRILRAETAAITALTLWQLRFGDLGPER